MTIRFIPPPSGRPDADHTYEIDATQQNETLTLPVNSQAGRLVTVRRIDPTGATVTVIPPNGETVGGVVNGATSIPVGGVGVFRVTSPGQWTAAVTGGPGGGGGGSTVTISPSGSLTVDGTTVELGTDAEVAAAIAAAVSVKADAARTITAGTGLTGGGDLTANRTLTVAYGTSSGTAAQGNDSRITGAAQRSGGNTFTGTQDFTGATVTGVSGGITNGYVVGVALALG